MKKKDVLVGSIINLIFLAIACVFARIFSNIAVKISNLFVELSFLSASGVRLVTLFLFAAFFILLFSYKYGYHTVCFEPGETLPSALVAAAAHFLISLMTLFSPWVAGATKHIGGFIAFGENYTSVEHMRAIPMITLIMIGVLMAVLYAGLLVLGTYEGTKKRLSDRAELLGENTSESK